MAIGAHLVSDAFANAVGKNTKYVNSQPVAQGKSGEDVQTSSTRKIKTPQWNVSLAAGKIKVEWGYVNWGGNNLLRCPSSGSYQEFEIDYEIDAEYYICWYTETINANNGGVGVVNVDDLSTKTNWKDYQILAILEIEDRKAIITQKQDDTHYVNASENASIPEPPPPPPPEEEEYIPEDPCVHPGDEEPDPEEPGGGGGDDSDTDDHPGDNPIDDPDEPDHPGDDEPCA